MIIFIIREYIIMPNPSKAHIFSPMQRSRTGRIECKYSIFFRNGSKKKHIPTAAQSPHRQRNRRKRPHPTAAPKHKICLGRCNNYRSAALIVSIPLGRLDLPPYYISHRKNDKQDLFQVHLVTRHSVQH